MKQLGQTDLQVSPLMFGGNVLGWTIDEQQSFEVLDGFMDAGMNFIDTADIYSRWAEGHAGGESETVLGNWMKERGNRQQVVLATKVGGDMGQGHRNVSKDYILKRVEDSLRRLKTDYIDLYQTHWDDEQTPVEETLEAYTKLVQSGKVRYIGASNVSPERLLESLKVSEAHQLVKYQTLQPHYNLYDREGYEKQYEQLCLDNQLGVLPYFSLASGFLTGKYRSDADFDKSIRGSSMGKFLNERGNKILAALDEVSARHNCEPASIALAWLMARPSITAPIASATSLKQLEALIKATEIRLSNEDVKSLNNASTY